MSEGVQTLTIRSGAFENGGTIPSTYACDGTRASPPLTWDGIPPDTRSLSLIMTDPDNPGPHTKLFTVVHWVVYNIPACQHSLLEDCPDTATLHGGAQQGITSSRRRGYMPPCPPFGTHRYRFELYALDTFLDLAPQKATRKAVLDAMQGHVLDEAELVGHYTRRG